MEDSPETRGLYIYNGFLFVKNSSFVGMSTQDSGGAILAENSDVTILNSSFVQNSAA